MIGRQFTHYDILDLAGRGAMGEVYKARDRRLGRLVAIKVISGESVSEERRRRFLREARAAALPGHPGIVSVYDIGQVDEVPFIAMEWVRGRTLREDLEGDPLPLERAVDLSLQLAEAMAAAHTAGVVHRDLKPSNVMIDEAGRARVLDFGIARFEGLAGDADTLTRTSDELSAAGASPGTFAYMSPEQILGEPVGAPSDIFSLGVVMYEMLAGRRPFLRPNLASLVQAIIFAEPEALPASAQALDSVVRRALAKSPKERYASMASLATELRQVQQRRGADGGGETEDLPRGWRRSSSAVGVAAVVTIAAVSVFTVLDGRRVDDLGGDSAQRPAAAETAPEAELPQDPYDLYREGLRLLDRYDRKGFIEQAIERFAAAIEVADDYAPAHSGLAEAYWRQYRLLGDPVWLHRAQASAGLALELDPQLSQARLARARVLTASEELDAASEELATLRRLDPANAEVPAAQGELAAADGRYDEAVSYYREALAIHPDDWSVFMLLGIAEARLGDLAAAETALRESTRLAPDSAYALRNLAGVLHFRGSYDEAARALQESISIRPSSSAYSNLGTIYFFQGFYGEAADAFESARSLGANNYLLWGNLGDAYRQIAGNEEQAADALRRAVQLVRRQLDASPEDVASRSRLAVWLAKLGQEEPALRELEQTFPREDWDAATAFRAAIVYELTGRRDLALDAVATALELGHPPEEVRREPELTRLRESVRYHHIVMGFEADADGPSTDPDQPSESTDSS